MLWGYSDLAYTFCLSIVFIEVSSKVEIHSYYDKPGVKILEDTCESFLKFVRCGFKDCVFV